jgi:hypothetical protein
MQGDASMGRRIAKPKLTGQSKVRAIGVAAALTAITLATLILEFPDKFLQALRSVGILTPPITVNVLQGLQPALNIAQFGQTSPITVFEWNLVYEIHNAATTDITIRDIINSFPLVFIDDRVEAKLERSSLVDFLNGRKINTYETLEAIGSNKGVEDKLPITIKAGQKILLKKFDLYTLRVNGTDTKCSDESNCLRTVTSTLGGVIDSAGAVRCGMTAPSTTVVLDRYRNVVAPQFFIALVEGCALAIPAPSKP